MSNITVFERTPGMNIFEKLAAITAELQTVAKNLTVQTTKTSSYKAVSERDILDAVKPLEAKYGVYSYPCGRTVLESNLLESESEYGGKVTKKTTFMTRIATVYRFVNVEKPEEYIETTVFSEGIDSQDKGSGKAMTYGDKYALMKAYKISTGDDPDQTASEDTNYKKAQYTKAPVKMELTPRQQLFARLKELGIDATEYAQQHKLDKTTPEEVIIDLLHDLEG
jgi:hypothetical protein